jgi:glycosyltransferase involved in cell wall biosynthesis
MKTALVHDWLNGMRGGEKVLEHISTLYPDAPIFTLHCDPEKISDALRRHEIITSFIQRLPLRRNYYRYYLPLFPSAVEKFRFDGCRLIISTSHCAAKGAIPPEGACHLCYSFTPMRYVWEFSDDYFGRNIFKRFFFNPALAWLRRWDRKTSTRVYRFACISKTVQQRIKEHYSRDAVVIYPPCNIPFQPEKEKDDYFLVLSALVPYKKIDIAVRVFNELRLPLRIAGMGTDERRLRKIAGPTISFLGWVSEEDKLHLFRKAKALIFPGTEDFGIAPLEAIACGTPVIAFGQGGALETVTEETGMFFSEQTPESLKNAITAFQKKPFTIAQKPSYFDSFSPEIFLAKFQQTVSETLDSFQKGLKPF